MTSSQSNFNLRSPGSYLARSYVIVLIRCETSNLDRTKINLIRQMLYLTRIDWSRIAMIVLPNHATLMKYFCVLSPSSLWVPQILADQLTLSQPRGADYAHQIIPAPSDFQTFQRPYKATKNQYIFSNISSVVEFQRWWVLKS